MQWEQTIYGEPASKANSRRAVMIGGKSRFIKSKKALDYAKEFTRQAKTTGDMLDEDGSQTCVEMTIWYASRRPDLDESLICDLLQGVAYHNDRSVKRKVIEWRLDRKNPRSEIRVTQLPPTYGED
jgi:Holliday junction resolvase RusA-like endonuclease|tara:strand:+ start:182 stop:559 length:378 start_codon:yes stop_codon:yes gene_type:complete